MGYRYLDLESYKRKNHFEYFNTLAYPYVGVSVNVDITELLKKVKAQGLPFFLTVCYCVCRGANAVPEFRQRIKEGRILEFDRCRTSHTVALKDGTYCYCTLCDTMPFPDYIPYALRAQERAKRANSISEEKEETYELFFISTLPWISFTGLTQPVPVPADSNPRITWGKYFVQEGRTLLPVSVLCHHGLVDGVHIGRFFEEFEKEAGALP